MINKILAIVTGEAKKKIHLVAKLFGANLLDKAQTLSELKSSELLFIKGELVELVSVIDRKEVIESSSVSVYCVRDEDSLEVLPYGGIKVDKDVLNLDFGSSEFIRSIIKRDTRKKIECESCIVLWSHKWGAGYYDYLIFIYAKLLRIKSAIGETEFEKCSIVYPFFGQSFEKELLNYAGVREDQIFDVRTFNVKAKTYYFGNNDSWFYPNLYDILLISGTIRKLIIKDSTKDERVFISRKGRRAVVNEKEVIEVVKEFGFRIIEDVPRSVKEQILIYRHAKVIIGPHGASFSNILWCKPQTMLIELFANNYYPPYYKYLASILNLQYNAIFEEGVHNSHYSNLNNDIKIDPNVIRSSLKVLLRDD